MIIQVAGAPHAWPRDGQTPAAACAVIVVDMQHDYCSPGFYIARAGYDTARLSRPIEPIQRVLAAARRAGMGVFFTRHGHAPRAAASDFPDTAARGEPGWEIVPALTPQPDEVIIEKSTINAFVSGGLDERLRRLGIHHLAFCGNTIDVCVHSTLRAAVDLDYECLLLADCCGAVNEGLHRWAVESVQVENGVFGTVANAEAFVTAVEGSR
jgi:nicotinamidase-related amidase